MNEQLKVWAYWGPRKESVEECAARLDVFLRMLARSDVALVRWFDTGRSRKDALRRPITPDRSTLCKLLLAGRNYSDGPGRKVIEDLGFLISIWNGRESQEAAGLMVCCGTYSHKGGNFCSLNISDDGPVAERILRVPVAVRLLKCFIRAWDSEHAAIYSDDYYDLKPNAVKRLPRIGWITYLPRSLGSVPPLPPPARVVPVGKQGSLIIATRERFTAGNPAHVEAADRVRVALNQAGLRTRKW